MGLSASLFLRQTQSLVMTPQLMQSIQLLQMTHFELTQFIAQEVEKNPLLEIASDGGENGAETGFEDNQAFSDPESGGDGTDGATEGHWYEGTSSSITAERLDEGLDTGFENVFPDDGPARRADAPELLSQWKSMPGGEAGEDYDLDDFVAGQVTLRDHMNQQVPFLLGGAADRLVAQHLVDQLDEAGYLQGDLQEIAARLGKRAEDVEAILQALQTLDPPGVFARSLSECLAIQLRQRNRLDPAMEALVNHLELLAKRDFASLRKICGVDDEDLIDMLAEIRGLNPKPGAGFESGVSETIAPDIVVRAAPDGSWMVELNPDTLPRVLVNQAYFQKVAKNCPKNGEDHNFLSECLQNANWLTRSLDQRAKTIMKVAAEIVRQQDAFLMHGVDHLRPLNLKTVAEAIKMHESTVSRVTSNKYMLTPRGLFELKYFFTVSIGSAEEGGDSHSAEAVRHRIRQMIAQETPDAVLSDDDIVISLKRGGVELARRTVAKYREAMNIPSSVQRRREKRALAKVAAF
ncbi:RNA polymerase, sigma 54 subunit, RpoN/SigL [Xaviernesmea oryzae]|uniref:RNA polymerase sigma-54 factor n=1 Tax=Xaviernesmea oryzae TaxID=464029 RepID=A0A1X7EUR6_9HYPH|nr:RNA polymerase factor sigma-54 [Xaviernesmea oryzae]SMF40623.1 RNA polymerase, sigma 54 subunit, RpoN/SigL [Xaviernesmea oryzae]